MAICLERSANDLHMVQLMPLTATPSSVAAVKSRMVYLFGASLPRSSPPFPQIDIIRAVVIVWRVRGKLSGLFCAVLCATIVHSAMHTHMNRLTGLWIGFCLTGPISLC